MILRSYPTQPEVPPFFGWRMVVLACLCVNIGAGFAFGTYSTFMSSMIREFSASRTLASAGLSVMVATMGLLGPVVGYTLRRWSIRATLGAGFILMSMGWGLISIAASAWQFTLSFGLLCGAASACLIVVPPMTLVNNWFIAKRGRASGVAMAMFTLMVLPPVVAASITAYGWRATALIISIICLLLTPLTIWVIDRPESVGQKPLGAGGPSESVLPATPSESTEAGAPMREPVFWVLMFCTGIFGGAAVAFMAHFIPFALEAGLTLKSASVLFSILGAAELAGGFAGGLVADRLGGARTYALTSFIQAIAWPCLLLTHQFWILALCVSLIGLCANSSVTVATTLFANFFGRAHFARVIGMFSLISTPFNFALPLLSGAVYDLSGSYRSVFVLNAALFVLLGTTFALAHRIEVSRRGASPKVVLVARC